MCWQRRGYGAGRQVLEPGSGQGSCGHWSLVFTMGMGNPPWVMGKGLSGLGLGQEVQTHALMGPIPIPGRDPWEL